MKVVAEGLEFPEGPVVLDDGSVLVVVTGASGAAGPGVGGWVSGCACAAKLASRPHASASVAPLQFVVFIVFIGA